MGNRNEYLRDRLLGDLIREAVERDVVLCGVRFQAVVRGGVVHALVDPVDAHRALELQRFLSRLRGVHAVWLRVDTPAFRCVDIGCGGAKQVEGAIGIDVARAPAADIRADLDHGLPFPDGSVDGVFAVHVLEHVHDLLPVMNEIHRVLKPGGLLHAMVPHRDHANAVADPTHVRFFIPQTFKYFCRPPSGVSPWYPELISYDGASIFADLRRLEPGEQVPEEQLALYFD